MFVSSQWDIDLHSSKHNVMGGDAMPPCKFRQFDVSMYFVVNTFIPYFHFSAVLINNLSCTDITCSNWPIQFESFSWKKQTPLSKQSPKLWILVCPIQQRNDPASGCNILSSFLKFSRLLPFIKSWCISHTLVEYIRSSSVDKRPTRGAFLHYMSVKVRFCRNGVPIRKI